jgi:hypothetical protein
VEIGAAHRPEEHRGPTPRHPASEAVGVRSADEIGWLMRIRPNYAIAVTWRAA